jgi:hypothetical protein
MENLEVVKMENSQKCIWWKCYIINAKYEFYWEKGTDSILVTKTRSAGLQMESKLFPEKLNAASVRACINKILKEF